MKNNKGFTLIELIGVLIIMSLLIMIVFPTMSRLMRDNDAKKYDYYYDIVLKGADSYASFRIDDLGGIKDDGCVDDITLSTLIQASKVKKYDDKKIICGTPSEFTADNGRPDLVGDLGLTGNYIDIKLTNTKGKVKSEASLICVKGKKVVYKKLIEKTGACDRHVAVAPNVLYDTVSTLSSVTDDNDNYYISGTVTNNYVWYSGKLWRVVGYNKTDRTIKLVTDSAISTLTYNMPSGTKTADFLNSNISVWLNNNFMNTLNNPKLYLLEASWDYSTVADGSIPSGAESTRSWVGLLNYYEYNKIQGFLNINQNWWLLSKKNDDSVWYVDSSNTVSNSGVGTFFGVRPSIVLKSNATYYSGADGTKENPYRLSGESSGNVGSLLSSRFVGEYVSFAGGTYRISAKHKDYVRLTSTTVLPDVRDFSYNESSYNSGINLGEYLTGSWLTSLSTVHQSLVVVADYCVMNMLQSGSQTVECPLESIANEKVAVPKIGDMFASASTGDYWTISPVDIRNVNVVTSTGAVTVKEIETTSGVRPVLSVSSDTEITGGRGTFNNPYTVG